MAPDMHKPIRVEKISMAKGLQGKTHTHNEKISMAKGLQG